MIKGKDNPLCGLSALLHLNYDMNLEMVIFVIQLITSLGIASSSC